MHRAIFSPQTCLPRSFQWRRVTRQTIELTRCNGTEGGGGGIKLSFSNSKHELAAHVRSRDDGQISSSGTYWLVYSKSIPRQAMSLYICSCCPSYKGIQAKRMSWMNSARYLSEIHALELNNSCTGRVSALSLQAILSRVYTKCSAPSQRSVFFTIVTNQKDTLPVGTERFQCSYRREDGFACCHVHSPQ